MKINEMAEAAHKLATEKGFWDDMDVALAVPGIDRDAVELAFYGQKVALIGEELGELTSALRKPGQCEKIPEMTGEEEEVADIVIRLMDYCVRRGIDLERVIRLKHEFNAGRPFKHGKSF